MPPKPQPLWHDDEPASIGVNNPLWHSDSEGDEDPLLVEDSDLANLDLYVDEYDCEANDARRASLSNSCGTNDNGCTRPLTQPKRSSISKITGAGTSEFASSFYESSGFSVDGISKLERLRRRQRERRAQKGASNNYCGCFIFVTLVALIIIFSVHAKDKDDGPASATPLFEPYVCEAAPAVSTEGDGQTSSKAAAGSSANPPLHTLMENYSQLDSMCEIDITANRAEQECMCNDPTRPIDVNVAADMLPQWQQNLKQSDALAKQSVSGGASQKSPDVVFLGESLTQWKGMQTVLDQVNGLHLGIDGERCSTLLYRLDNGGIPDELTPKVWWITVGANDVTDMCNLDGIHAGIAQIVDKIQQLRPGAQIVLNAFDASKSDFRLRHLNQRMSCLADSTDNVDAFNPYQNVEDDDFAEDVTSSTSSTKSEDPTASMVDTIRSYL